jgi:hypothetical protein
LSFTLPLPIKEVQLWTLSIESHTFKRQEHAVLSTSLYGTFYM